MSKATRSALGLLAIALICASIWKLTRSGPARLPIVQEEALGAKLPEPPRELEALQSPTDETQRIALASPPQPSAEERPPFATLRVLARSKADQRPLAGVRISLALADFDGSQGLQDVPGTSGKLQQVLTTEEQGRVEFEAPCETGLVLSAYGRDGSAGWTRSEVLPLSAGEVREISLELPTGNDLPFFGRVIDLQTRAPIPGARVLADEQADGQPSEHADLETTADADGRFELQLASWKLPGLRIDAEGFGLAFVMPRTGHEDALHAKEIALSRSANLRVTVLDARGSPLGGIEVTLATASGNLAPTHEEEWTIDLPDPTWTAGTDVYGHAVITALPSEVPLRAALASKGRVVLTDATPLILQPSETREVEYRIGAGCRLTGTVVDQDGQAVAGQELLLARAVGTESSYLLPYMDSLIVQRTRTDENGSFAMDDVGAGSWWLGPACSRSHFGPPKPDLVAPAAEVVEIEEGTAQLQLTLRVQRGLYIRGRVVNAAGLPAKNCHVVAGECPVGGLIDTQANSKGEFALGPLVPGRHTLHASRQAGDFDSDSVAAEAGESGLVLALRPGSKLAGTVLDSQTQSGCPAEVMLSGEGPEWSISFAENDGRFQFGAVGSGRYSLYAHTSDGRCGLIRGIMVGASGDSSDLVIMLQVGAKLRVRYEGEQECASVRVTQGDMVLALDDIRRDGHGVEWTLPAGDLTVRHRSGEASWIEVPVQLATGETREIILGKD